MGLSNQKKSIMNCLNCGHQVADTNGRCPTCNIPLEYYGVSQMNHNHTEHKEKITGTQCPNCHGMQSDELASNCEYCNFPLHHNDRKTTEKREAEPTFAWRQVGQSRFNMVADGWLDQLIDIDRNRLNFSFIKPEGL